MNRLKIVSGHLNPCYGEGTTKVWYTRPEHGRDFRMGVEWLKEHNQLPDPRLLGAIERTHVEVGCVNLDNLDDVYDAMQGERWSPRGEARSHIMDLGLAHTSMCVGDIIQKGTKFWMVDGAGFEYLGDANDA